MAAPARGRSSRTRTRGAGRWPANASRDTVRRCRSGLDPAAFDGQMSAARTAGLERLRAHGPYASPPPPRRVDLVRCGNATSARVGARSFRECSLLCQAAIAICDESGSARGCRLEGEIWGCDGSRAAARGRQRGLGCVVGVRGGRNRAVIAAVCGRQLRRWVFTANASAPENAADRLLVGAV